MTHLVIGLGEVGKALQTILECDGHDRFKDKYAKSERADIIHIAFPYSEDFESQVQYYQKMFQPQYTVVHSTVPIGTCKKLGVIHSPIRGKHPSLVPSILTFTKYFAGPGAEEVAKEMTSRWPFTVEVVKNSDDTEAGKLFDLMQYGISILLNKEIWQYCQKHGLDFEVVYTHFNNSYNTGYHDMRMPEVTRPVLKYVAGKIGGHCVVQMMDLLDTESAKKIIKENAKI